MMLEAATMDAAARVRVAPADCAFVGLIALVLVTPFEPLQPVIQLPWQNVTSVELAVALCAGTLAATLVWTRSSLVWRTPLTLPWVAMLTCLLTAAALAPAHRVNALKAVARLAEGFVICVIALNAITTLRRMAAVMSAALAIAVVVAVIAILESLGVAPVLAWLNHYRDGVRVVGGQVRAGATLQYPTIAAMYFEIALSLGLGLALFAWDTRNDSREARRAWPIVAAAIAALAIVGEALSLTYTRAGLVGAGAAFLTVGAWRIRRQGVDSGVRLIGALGVIVLVLPLATWPRESRLLRFSSEGRQGWYRAHFLAAPALAMTTGEEALIDVNVVNAGRVTWQPRTDAPFRASYHWLDADTDRVVQYDGARTELPADVPPGATAALTMQVRAPEKAGRYRLAWDIVQEHRLWFSTEAGASLTWTSVDVVAGAAPARPLSVGKGPRVVPPQVVVLGRLALWRAAAAMAAAHPVLGVGPDNFRLSYGSYAGLSSADQRVHSNNMYLEWLTGGGVVGLIAFGWLLRRAQLTARVVSRAMTSHAFSLYAGAAGAGVAVLVHGALDSFLTFTPSIAAVSLTLGLLAAPSIWPEACDAHRV